MHNKFDHGDFYFNDAAKLGRSCSFRNEENIELAKNFVSEYLRLSTNDATMQLSINFRSIA